MIFTSTTLAAGGRIGGGGVVQVQGTVQVPDGATLDPARLDLQGRVTLRGTSAFALPELDLNDGTLDSTRTTTTITTLKVQSGTLTGGSTFIVPAGGSFITRTAGSL